MKSIFDRSFKYVSAAETDVAATFRRVRRRLLQEAETRALNDAEAKAKVSTLKQRKAGQ